MERLTGFENIYENKVVLITGHTGFKGSWLSIWLNALGAKVVGYSLEPYTVKDNYVLSNIGTKIIDIKGDILDSDKLSEVFRKYKPQFVFHLAAQALVNISYKFPESTYQSNVIGTINVLEQIRKSETVEVGIFITSDKCYENKEQIWSYREIDPLGGYDPYSSSKAAAEIAINSWRCSYFNPERVTEHGKAIASARAGNVIGGGDWSIGRLIPDCINGIENNSVIKIRHPKSLRPWQHVLEPLAGYLRLGQLMLNDKHEFSQAWNFGPYNNDKYSVSDIVEMLVGKIGKGDFEYDSNNPSYHEAENLTLDISKSQKCLGWKPVFDIKQAVELTTEWYCRYQTNDVHKICLDQIEQYSSLV